jgi:branched-chain amino acid transport system permease protein
MTGRVRQCIDAIWLPAFLCAGLATCVGIGQLVEGDSTRVTLTEMLIRLGVVVGIYIFIGNSGIMSFGQIGFMCIGAYATAWATLDPNWKQIMLQGLPHFLKDAIYPFPVPMLMGATLASQ